MKSSEQDTLCDTPLNEITWTVFDLETTGIDAEHDTIVEIAAVHVMPGFRIDHKNTFNTLVNPEVDIPARSTDIHGITNEMVKKAPDFMTAYYSFADFARDTVLIAHNSAKDMAFLRVSLSEYFTRPSSSFVTDSLRSALFSYNGTRHVLERLSNLFHFDKRINGPHHRALPLS